MIIRMLTNLRVEVTELRKNFKKDLESMIKNQAELKNTITEMKNMLEGINNRLDNTEEWISNLEDRLVEVNQSEQQKVKRILKSKDCLGTSRVTVTTQTFV